MALERLDDPADPRLAPYRNVPDPDLLRQHRLFVAEGRLVVRTLLTRSSFRTQSVLVTPAALEHMADLTASRTDVPWLVVPQPIMNEIVGFDIHRGCLAVGERGDARSLQDLLDAADRSRGSGRLVVLEHVANADNVGGIFRCAAAFGASGVVLGPRCCDPLYRKAIRTSIGASLHVPFAVTDAWPAALHVIRSRGYRVAALTPSADARDLHGISGELAAASRVAVVAGWEGTGLTGEALACADVRVRIPTSADVDSLNVTVAVGIALHRIADL